MIFWHRLDSSPSHGYFSFFFFVVKVLTVCGSGHQKVVARGWGNRRKKNEPCVWPCGQLPWLSPVILTGAQRGREKNSSISLTRIWTSPMSPEGFPCHPGLQWHEAGTGQCHTEFVIVHLASMLLIYPGEGRRARTSHGRWWAVMGSNLPCSFPHDLLPLISILWERLQWGAGGHAACREAGSH